MWLVQLEHLVRAEREERVVHREHGRASCRGASSRAVTSATSMAPASSPGTIVSTSSIRQPPMSTEVVPPNTAATGARSSWLPGWPPRALSSGPSRSSARAQGFGRAVVGDVAGDEHEIEHPPGQRSADRRHGRCEAHLGVARLRRIGRLSSEVDVGELGDDGHDGPFPRERVGQPHGTTRASTSPPRSSNPRLSWVARRGNGPHGRRVSSWPRRTWKL